MGLADLSCLPHGTIGVAVSGGMDSMCLAHDLLAHDVPIAVLTVDHGIRGEQSHQDYLFVQQWAAQAGVPCIARAVDVPAYCRTHKVGEEEGARALRYAFFHEVLQAGSVACIATAHHRDDLSEGVLLNVLRGAGWRGLSGLAQPRPDFVRPLLGVSRAQIRAYAQAHDVPYREDATNQDTAYRRNFVRHEVLPLLETRYPAAKAKLAELAELAWEQQQLLDSLAIPPTVEGERVYLPLSALSQPAALAKWSIGLAFRHFDHGVDFGAAHYQAVAALRDSPYNTTLDLPCAVKVAKEYDRLTFWRAAQTKGEDYPFGEGVFAFGTRTFRIRPYHEGDRLRFDADRIPPTARIRLRRQGDVITKFGGGTKSLGDYYTDNKLPLRERDACPVVAVDDRVLVCVVNIADSVRVTAQTKRIFTFEED